MYFLHVFFVRSFVFWFLLCGDQAMAMPNSRRASRCHEIEIESKLEQHHFFGGGGICFMAKSTREIFSLEVELTRGWNPVRMLSGRKGDGRGDIRFSTGNSDCYGSLSGSLVQALVDRPGASPYSAPTPLLCMRPCSNGTQ